MIDRFKKEMIEGTLDHYAIESSSANGMFSFAQSRANPELGLALAYREYKIPFLGFMPEFYLGVFKWPPDHEELFEKGPKDSVHVGRNYIDKMLASKNPTSEDKGFSFQEGSDNPAERKLATRLWDKLNFPEQKFW